MSTNTKNSKVFLLSPARTTGKRAQMVMRPQARFELALRLRTNGASIGELFRFMSGLYFRGKLAYAESFAVPPAGLAGAYVITSCLGLVPVDRVLTLDNLRALSDAAIHHEDAAYVSMLQRDARRLCEAMGGSCTAVLLGSIATAKYLAPLRDVFGERLLFPEPFIGRGDMSRGGLMLRAAQTGVELSYKPVGTGTHHGARPPRLMRRGGRTTTSE